MLLMVPVFAHAGVYGPDEPCPFAVKHGIAEELSYAADNSGRFAEELVRITNIGDANPARSYPERKAVLARLGGPPPTIYGRAADLIRTRRFDAAVNLLAANSRSSDFRVLANRAHTHALRGEWPEAITWHSEALLADPPASLDHATPEQKTWLLHVEKDYYRTWLRLRRDEALHKPTPEAEDVLALFPMRFVNEAGRYEPGHLAAAERGKLPADAIAIVQQLILWDVDDTRLDWLLAEMYAADGRFREANRCFDSLAWSKQQSNKKVLMDHRTAVRRAMEAMPALATAADTPLPAEPDDTRDIWQKLGISPERAMIGAAVFALIGGLLLLLQARSVRRKFFRK